MERGFQRSEGPTEGEGDEWGEGEADPKDGLGEEGECPVSVPLAFDLFEDEVARCDPSKQGQFRDVFARAGLHRPKYRAGENPE